MELRWDLSTIYASFDCPEIIKDINRLKDIVETKSIKYLTYFKDYNDVSDKLLDYITTINELNSLYLKLAAYARLHSAIDNTCEVSQKLHIELNSVLNDLTKINSPFLRFLQKIGNIEQYIRDNKVLEDHAFILNELKVQSASILSENEEDLLSELQSTGSYSFEALHEEILKSLMVDVKIGSDTKSIPLSVARNMAYAQSGELRKAAFKAELKAYSKVKNLIASCLNAIKGESIIISTKRGFASPLHMTLADCRMERSTLDAMFEAIKEALPEFRRYLRKKAQLLGHANGLPFYDLYAPMGEFTMHFTYEEARDLIINAFEGFSEDLGNYAKKAFDEQWIDLEPRDGKINTTFCCNIHSIGQSRIMCNFTGTFYDLITLAHELGHGYHGEKLKHQSILNTDYTMPLAEASSIFCESLVTDYILKTASKEERFAILENELLNNTQICVEILARFTFETNLFEKRKNGPLTVEELNELMINAEIFAYGDGLNDELHKYMWACKPHYYFPDFNFYNFPYPYGLLFSKGLYALYKEEGNSFSKKFEQILASTGTKSIRDVFLMFDRNSNSKEFYKKALSLILEQIEEFCLN